MRPDGRQPHEIRPITIEPDFIRYPEGSVLYRAGDTAVLCNASVLDFTAPFLRGSGEGWVTAEYAMLPRATDTRSEREIKKGRPSGRSQEIQRLIGRSLRAVTDMSKLGERTIWLDCDVLQADGGTRTASITGAFVALHLALQHLAYQDLITELPIRDFVAAISVGMLQDTPQLDLNYEEDSTSDVDMNVVMTGSGSLIEIQGTAEGKPFAQESLLQMLQLARQGIAHLVAAQRTALGL